MNVARWSRSRLPTKISAKISGVHFNSPAVACACRHHRRASRAGIHTSTRFQPSLCTSDDHEHTPTMAPSLASIPDAYLWLGLGTFPPTHHPPSTYLTNQLLQASSPSSPSNKSPTASATSCTSPRSATKIHAHTMRPNAYPPTRANKKTPSRHPRSSRSQHHPTSTSARARLRFCASASTLLRALRNCWSGIWIVGTTKLSIARIWRLICWLRMAR